MNPDVESISWLRFIFATVVVLGLMALLGWGLKLVSTRGWLTPRHAKGRLKVVTSLPLDTRRRLVIAKCDDTEYLLLLGPAGDCVLSRSDAPQPSPTDDTDAL